jgi:hypothetical protein
LDSLLVENIGFMHALHKEEKGEQKEGLERQKRLFKKKGNFLFE